MCAYRPDFSQRKVVQIFMVSGYGDQQGRVTTDGAGDGHGTFLSNSIAGQCPPGEQHNEFCKYGGVAPAAKIVMSSQVCRGGRVLCAGVVW